VAAVNHYGLKAKQHLLQHFPDQYGAIEDPEAYFTEIGEEAERQVSSTYLRLSKPELGEKDLAARMMAEESIQELIYPTSPEQPEEPMDPDSAMAFSIQVQQDLWAAMDSDQPDRKTLLRQER
jgi:hypothetical protein